MSKKSYSTLRSARWFAPDDVRSFGHRSRVMQLGYAPADWVGKPVIAILNTWSDMNTCHGHFKQRVEDVKRGVLQAGGFPLEFPALSLDEPTMKPTTMLYRNLLAMETEEQIRSHPIDGVVLMGGCDKTTPGLIMGALSAGVPFIYLPAGPMLRGNWRGKPLGSGSDTWKLWDERRAGKLTAEQWTEVEGGIARSHGHCMTMGTASTMTGIAEACGLTLPNASSIPAVDSNHIRMSAKCGRRIVDMVWEDLTPAKMLTRQHFENGITVAMAMGCSTNAIIHLIAMSRRAGEHCAVSLDDFDAASRKVPVIANIRPSGDTYLMEDFYYAGGLAGMMTRLTDHLHLNAMTVSGISMGETLKSAMVHNDDVIRPLSNPIYAEGALAVLRGNLAPSGCVMKPSACAPKFFKHTGRALVYDNYEALKKDTDNLDLDVRETDILILRNYGPQGAGMPESGMLPIPLKLVQQGVRDMIRISDARMSGTSYGACILHVSPEAAIGGPLALVKTGDTITVDVPARTINLNVSDTEIAARKAIWDKASTSAIMGKKARWERGYGFMFRQRVMQADTGCDFDFLETTFGAAVPEPDIH
ncbi:MAG: L-arabinonate dehydratase [Cytophagales bacterium]|nr:L-arabinonate dehydratase [Cytophagales bacterium]